MKKKGRKLTRGRVGGGGGRSDGEGEGKVDGGGWRLGQSPTTKKEQARKTGPNGSGWEGSVSTRQEGGRQRE